MTTLDQRVDADFGLVRDWATQLLKRYRIEKKRELDRKINRVQRQFGKGYEWAEDGVRIEFIKKCGSKKEQVAALGLPAEAYDVYRKATVRHKEGGSIEKYRIGIDNLIEQDDNFLEPPEYYYWIHGCTRAMRFIQDNIIREHPRYPLSAEICEALRRYCTDAEWREIGIVSDSIKVREQISHRIIAEVHSLPLPNGELPILQNAFDFEAIGLAWHQAFVLFVYLYWKDRRSGHER